jgi:NMD protein affecting ribosome stability and mRNA decay
MTKVRCYVCGMSGAYYHDECWEVEKTSGRQLGSVAGRMAELVSKARDMVEAIIAQDLPRGAQYRVRAAVLAKMLEEIRDEVMALQAL